MGKCVFGIGRLAAEGWIAVFSSDFGVFYAAHDNAATATPVRAA